MTTEMAERKVAGDDLTGGRAGGDRFTYDMCMVFKVVTDVSDEKTIPVFTGPDIVKLLQESGLETKLYQSTQKDEVYCLIGASEARLELEADRIDLDVLLDKKAAIEAGYKKGVRLAKVTKERDEKSSRISEALWDNIYGKFDRDPTKKDLYTKYNQEDPVHANSCFRSVDRINLIVSIIEAPRKFRGCGLAISKLLKLKNTHLLAFFALHEKAKKEDLERHWLSIQGTLSQPLDEIRDYLGEKIALYFAFLQFYTRMLAIPAIIGVLFAGLQYTQSLAGRDGTWVFYLCMIAWCTSFLELWRQQESALRVKWGMTKFSQKEQPRPEYHGDWVYSPIDGKLESYFPFWKKFLRALQSFGVIAVIIVMLLSCMVGVFIARFIIQQEGIAGDKKLAPVIIGSVLNVFNIQFWNFVYGQVAAILNEYENHRTDTEFENALIGKSFLFKFVNSYNALFYLAFFKQMVEGDKSKCTVKNDFCMKDVGYQLFIVFGLMIVLNNALEILIPMIKGLVVSKQQSRGAEGEKSEPEKQFELESYESTFADYDELAVQFGFVNLFVVAFPLAPLFAFVNNIIELNVDASKLLRLTKRPEPRGAENIGTWFDIFRILGYVSVVTNLIMVAFYSTEVREYFGLATKNNLDQVSGTTTQALNNAFYMFVVVEHILLIFKLSLEYFIPDDPEWVQHHIARQEYIAAVLIEEASEEADEDFLVAEDKEGTHYHMGGLSFDLKAIPLSLESNEHCAW